MIYAAIKGLSLINPELTTVLEFGVASGKSLRRIRNSNKDIVLHGFDTFVGLPEDWIDMNGNIVGNGVKGRFDRGGNFPNVPNVTFHKGLFRDTIPRYIKQNHNPIAMIHIDCDLYSSTKDILYKLNEYIVVGTILVFDEWIYNHNTSYNDHEQRAFYEWVSDCNRKYEVIKFIETSPKNLCGDDEKKIIKILK